MSPRLAAACAPVSPSDPLCSRGAYNRVIGDENHDRTDHGDHETVEIQPRDTALAEERKDPPADDRTYDAEDQVANEAFSGLVDDLAAKEPSDDPKHDPSDQ